MAQFVLISIGSLVVGLAVGVLLVSLIDKLVKDFIPISIAMLCGSLVSFLAGVVLRLLFDENLFFYFAIMLSGVLIVLPAILLVNVYLLWWNPAKYKEYSMKKRQRERRLAQSKNAPVED